MTSNSWRKFSYRLMRLMVRFMPSCREVSGLVSQGMDRQLPLQKRLAIRLHVSMCGWCRLYEKQLQLIHKGVRHYADPEKNRVEKSLSPEARERLQKKLTEIR